MYPFFFPCLLVSGGHDLHFLLVLAGLYFATHHFGIWTIHMYFLVAYLLNTYFLLFSHHLIPLPNSSISWRVLEFSPYIPVPPLASFCGPMGPLYISFLDNYLLVSLNKKDSVECSMFLYYWRLHLELSPSLFLQV